jgi:hypothetical protein
MKTLLVVYLAGIVACSAAETAKTVNGPQKGSAKFSRSHNITGGIDYAYASANAPFSLAAPSHPNYKYTWYKGTTLLTTTTDTYNIRKMQQSDVDTYTILITKNDKTDFVLTVHLFMYRPSDKYVNSGSLTCPIGCFAASSLTCSGITFLNGYSLSASGGVPQLFYGGGYPLSSQTGPFVNDHNAKLRIYTVDGENPGTSATGVRLQQNWIPLLNLFCNGALNGASGDANLNAAVGTIQNTYRGMILYNGSPSTGSIVFHWEYHN